MNDQERTQSTKDEQPPRGNGSELSGLVSRPEAPPFGIHPKGSFPYELEQLINKHSAEGGSDTPDYILAEYLKGCLENFDMCVRRREQNHRRNTLKSVCG